MKRILFVGDTTPAMNYGSIATSDAMKKMLSDIVPDNDLLKTIDIRSYYMPTPKMGFPADNLSFKQNNTVVSKIKKMIPADAKGFYKKKIKREKWEYHVPYKLSQYEEFYAKIEEGEIFEYEKEVLDWADIVICSGEGALVNGIDEYGRYLIGGLYQLFILWLAKTKFNKPTLIVNHTVDTKNSAANEIIKELYPKLDYVAVRERYSLNTLKNLGVDNACFVPDALFTYAPDSDIDLDGREYGINFSEPFICIGDTSGFLLNAYNTSVKWNINEVFSSLIAVLRQIVPQIVFVDGFRGKSKAINKLIQREKLPYLNLNNCSYQELFSVLKKAELFISGRWHASILASVANTPILLLGADSHKTKALFDVLETEGDFFDTDSLPIFIEELAQSAKMTIANKLKTKEKLNLKIKQLAIDAEKNVTCLERFL